MTAIFLSRFTGFFPVSALLAAVAGCATVEPLAPKLPGMSVGVTMAVRNLCYAGTSPRIDIPGAPPGSATFRIQNISALFTTGTDDEVTATGPVIPEGAIGNYRGICAGERQNFMPCFRVLALDARGYAIGHGTAYSRVNSTSFMPKLCDDDTEFSPTQLLPAAR